MVYDLYVVSPVYRAF